ncbi:glycosyltransferase family 2 protein [Mongoliibacter ruber]|uniref:Glycosyl transferase family 2 n=1 Tax=Mongoliibacter ruber TaxID=1750599 RepID=A0A2T0WNS8_9BACT|nr:glycosyltransferase family 2 protein [Mongoliibacter ruber]PRY88361.1 glycosyl transferase family 2 [Mongoliibacter ruber]
MLISLITVTYNSEKTLLETIKSVKAQNYHSIQYIVIDGASTDGTINLIENNNDVITTFKSEPDQGIYDAMNKGIRLATGDIVGIINSDDFFFDNQVLSTIAKEFEDQELMATIGDIVFVNSNDENKIIRKYSSKKWSPSKFAWGYMPAHPSFFVRRDLFDHLGFYKTDYKIAADYELLIRFLLKNSINWKYLPLITTKMRMGGASTSGLKSLITLNKEILRACKENGVYSNYLMIYSKYFLKPFEFLFTK